MPIVIRTRKCKYERQSEYRYRSIVSRPLLHR